MNALALMTVFYWQKDSILRWRFQWDIARRMLRECVPLLLSAISIVLYMKVDQVMLRQMVTDEAAGLYAVAVRISESWYFFPTVIMSSFFPVLSTTIRQDPAAYYARTYMLMRFMVALSVCVAIPMTFFSEPIITLVFGMQYRDAGPILAVHIWSGLSVAMGITTSPWIFHYGYTKIALYRTLVGLFVNLLLNLLLIPSLAGLGAAIATTVSYACATFGWYAIDKRAWHLFVMQLRALLLFLPYKAPRVIV
ncbi:MAG: oligosaccharide flippase family protein [Caldilineaceae bacterium]|nr:oligosaccharide flippase family protein [Caldilineaceae bacterium]